MSLKLAFYLHFRCSVVVCRWNSGIREPQFREMGNTGRNLASEQITPIFFDNHHASQKRLVVILALSVSAYRLSTNLGTVLHRKITTRRLMTLVSSSDLFKPVCGIDAYLSCIFRMSPSCCGVKPSPDKARSQEQKVDRN